MDHRQERIRIETERHRIEGSLTLARDGYRSRVSDVLNASERDFLTLTEVTVEPLDGGPVELHRVPDAGAAAHRVRGGGGGGGCGDGRVRHLGRETQAGVADEGGPAAGGTDGEGGIRTRDGV